MGIPLAKDNALAILNPTTENRQDRDPGLRQWHQYHSSSYGPGAASDQLLRKWFECAAVMPLPEKHPHIERANRSEWRLHLTTGLVHSPESQQLFHHMISLCPKL